MLDFPLMLRVKLPVVERIQSQSDQFVTGVESKATGDSKLIDSSAIPLNATLLVPAYARCLPTLGDRAFQSAAPKLWNSLPVEIRNIQTLTSFKRGLKTYFLRQLFN